MATRTTPSGASAARERLLQTASELFYREGIHSVGVDRIIAAAGVTRATFYRHFPSKEDLVEAYLGVEDATIRGAFDAANAATDDPDELIGLVIEGLADDVARLHTRGCPFINAAAEYPDAGQSGTAGHRRAPRVVPGRARGPCSTRRAPTTPRPPPPSSCCFAMPPWSGATSTAGSACAPPSSEPRPALPGSLGSAAASGVTLVMGSRDYPRGMSRTVWTVIGVVVAVIIAWFLVDVLFSLLWFIGKLAIVAVVAVIVFLVLRSVVGRPRSQDSIER